MGYKRNLQLSRANVRRISFRILESEVPWDLDTLNNISHGATGYLGLATIDESGNFKRKVFEAQE